MREAKYRAWLKKESAMVNVTRINFDLNEIEIHPDNDYDYYEFDFSEVVLMQYTGLKDKNGSEIYEGDILELINEDGEKIKAVCKFGNRRLTTEAGITIDVQCFYFEVKGRKTNPVVSNYLGKHDLEIMEIRGREIPSRFY
ncbi:MAG TPA: YopX family protein [Clostridia bacterium]|nr:YopX family protein [Clostridia bacterium]